MYQTILTCFLSLLLCVYAQAQIATSTDKKSTTHVAKPSNPMKGAGHTEAINSVAISPRNVYVLTGSADGTAKLWTMFSGKLITTFTGHQDEVSSVAFSPDGEYVLTGSYDKTVRVWATFSGKLVKTFTLYGKVSSIAFSPDGTRIAVGDESGNTAFFWANSFEPLHMSYVTHPFRAILEIAFSPDGKWLMTGAEGGDIFVWPVEDVKLRQKFRGIFKSWRSKRVPTEDIQSVEVLAGGKQVLIGSCNNQAEIWNVETGKVIKTFAGHKDCVISARRSPDGKQVLTASRDGRVKIWDIKSGKLLRTIVAYTHWINSTAFSANGKYVLTGSLGHSAKLWEVASGKLRQTY